MERRLLLAAHVAGSSTSYATIQAAVNAAAAGGTVTVDPGTYAEQVTVTKPLTLRGAQAGVDARGSGRPSGTAATESVVSGAPSGGVNSSAFHVLANDVTIDGFTVAGETSQDDQYGAGIVIGPGQSGTHVTDDVVVNNVSGLFLANASTSDAALIQHDYFASNNNPGDNGGRGIYTDGTISGGNLTNVTIDANTFYNNHGTNGTTYLEAALAFEAGNPGEQSGFRITNNSFAANGKATLFFNTTNVLIQGNSVTGCLDQYSGSLRFEGDNNNVQILYNTIYNNSGPGVAVDSKGMPGDNYAFVVNYDNFYGNNYAYSVPISVGNNFDTYDGSFDARYNYWGAASGPSGYGPGTGDAVGGGAMDLGTGTGWHLSAGGNMLYAPWATATVTATATAPAAPANLTATATSTAQVGLTWTDNAAGNESGFVVQRGTDGTTYAQVGTTASGVTTFADAAGLAAGTKYYYRVYAVNATGTSAASNVATATTPTPTPTPTGTAVSLTTLTPTSATVGWGALQTNADIKGTPLTIRGTVYPMGLGAHASSTITYSLAGKYATFASYAGVDDDTLGQGSVDFQVYGDGKLLYDSGVLTGTSPVAHLSVSVAGVQTLTLDAFPGVAGSIDYDHADWAAPQLTAATTTSTTPTATVPTAPSGLTATAASASQVNLAWTAATGQTAYAVDRSTDGGTTWTTVATPAATATTYADPGLAAATAYTYRVRATNAVGTSAASNTATSTTAAAATTTPTPTVTALTGALIGTAGSYQSAGNTIAKAVDGSLTTFFDGPVANGDWVGYDLGTAASVTKITFAPRSGWASRMVGGVFQASSSATFASGVTTLYTVSATPTVGSLTTVTLSPAVSARYVRYLSPNAGWGNIAELTFYGTAATAGTNAAAALTTLTGTTLGTAGSYQNDGNTIAKAVDGDLSTFFDGPTANGNWVGLDLGSAKAVSQVSFAPRAGCASRMVGGAFQASTSADFSTGVTTLYTITTAPTVGSLTTVTLATPATAEYVRYLSPAGSYGNVAEVVFAG